jgi:hypothetical protein
MAEPDNDDQTQYAARVMREMRQLDPQVGEQDWQGRLWELH